MTTLLNATNAGIAEAAALLRDGRLVAFGTETVYGLGASANSAEAVAAIFAAKHRPAHNPLICHYDTLASAAADVHLPPPALRLAEAFWPGPLTLVLPRRPGRPIAPAVSPADTLAVRVPGHAIACRLLAAVGGPIAAPSANISGRPSPTCAAHVLDSLDGRIDAVLDCGPCAIGLESTIVDLSGPVPALLRHGGISIAAIKAVIGPLNPAGHGVLRAPGQLSAHYAPVLTLRLNARMCGSDEALLAYGPPIGTPGAIYQLSAARNDAEAAARLFDGLRALDIQAAARGLRGLAAMPIPTEGIGAAINDRLARAAQGDAPCR